MGAGGGERINKKLLAVVFVLAVVLMVTPFVSANPGSEKNNERFLPFEINKVSGKPVGPIVAMLHPEPPKETQFRRVIIPEGLVFGEIVVDDGAPYILGVDFTYESTITMDFHLNAYPVFCTMTVDQAFVFIEATSGISGRLEVQTVGIYWPNGRDGASLSESEGSAVGHGTGELEGVLLKATGWQTGPNVHYEGYVTGWPGIP